MNDVIFRLICKTRDASPITWNEACDAVAIRMLAEGAVRSADAAWQHSK